MIRPDLAPANKPTDKLQASLDFVAGEVRRYDRDRFVTILLAPADKRPALFALHGFNLELARIRESVSEVLLGEMRLQWWGDVVEKLGNGDDLAHPVAKCLAEAMREDALSRPLLRKMIEARAFDLTLDPPADLIALEIYAQGTAGNLVRLALEVLGIRDSVTGKAADHAGVAWALTGLMRSVPFHASAGRCYLPTNVLKANGIDQYDLQDLKPLAQLTSVARTLVDCAREHIKSARALYASVPHAAVPALLPVRLAEIYLDRLERNGFDLMDRVWSETRPPAARLAVSAWFGRY